MSIESDNRSAAHAATTRDGHPGQAGVSPGVERDDRVWVWGVPFVPWTMERTIASIGEMIRAGKPCHVITANTHYVKLCSRDRELHAINARATCILADGMPLVWASRFGKTPLPERVAGSDLLFRVAAEAASKGFRLFLMGGAEGVADETARRLATLYPGLQVVGTAWPPFRDWTAEEEADLIAQIRAARPEIVVTALTMPKGERWLSAHLEDLGVPVVFNAGAAMDFAVGRVRRAPRWLQRTGLEWSYRLWLEPRRLAGRYAQDGWFILRMLASSVWGSSRGRMPRTRPPGSRPEAGTP